MIIRAKITFWLVSFLCLGCTWLRAWNGEGHMLVAQIAYNHLDPAVKAKCDALVALPVYGNSQINNGFVPSACWADDVKSDLNTGTWHYIDLPFSLDGTPTIYFSPPAFDVVQAINACVAALQDMTVAPTNQAMALRYLLHFVGDIQQPLHCSTAISSNYWFGDAGGNGFTVAGGWGNLHSLWDAGGGYLQDGVTRPLNAFSQDKLNSKVVEIETNYPYASDPGVLPDPMTWALEGWNLAQTNAYAGISMGSVPTTNYLASVQAVTRQRMAAGGHRLADLLNTLFTPIRLAPASCTNGILLSWNAVIGQAYHVQVKTELTGAWSNLADVTAVSNMAAFNDSFSGANATIGSVNDRDIFERVRFFLRLLSMSRWVGGLPV